MSVIRRTKIVCTIGPASDTPEMLAALLNAGMNVARLNFSHGSHDEHRARFNRLRDQAAQKKIPLAILQDLSGPKLRTGSMAAPAELKSGATFILTNRDVPGDGREVSVTYRDLPLHVQIGETILLADGSIQLQVVDKNETDLICRVIDGGGLSSKKGINLPQTSLPIPALTEKDKADLEFGLEAGVDYIALSFVRRAQDIQLIKEVMAAKNRFAPVIAKIEKHEALENIDAIIAAADGIMVARGDLAVETPLERVPLVQKALIKKCNLAGKPVITATQMLKSMVDEPRPTRAEANDVANAVFDGTDAVMLSEETAMGQYPIDAVGVMSKILQTTENGLTPRDWLQTETHQGKTTVAAAVSHAAIGIAQDLNVSAILTPTRSGATARMLARYRPRVPIVAVCHRPETYRALSLVWGVHPIALDEGVNDSDVLIAGCKAEALRHSFVAAGDTVLITAGLPLSAQSTTNLIKVEVI